MDCNGLKKTNVIWLPEIPKHWSLIKVRHLFKETTVKGFPNEKLLVASQKHGVVSKETFGKRTVEATKDFHLLKLVDKGDFVISLRSFQGGIEYAHERGIISPAYTILKETQKINKKYFKHLFKSSPFISLMTLCVKGIREGQNIDYSTFKREFLPFPPLEEQESIGIYLDKKTKQIEEFISKKERLIVLLGTQINAEIRELVRKGIEKNKFKSTNIDWIGDIPNHWYIKPLFSLFEKVKIKNDKKEDYKILSLSYGNVIYKNHDSNLGLVPTNYDSYQIVEPNQLVFRFTDLQNDQKSLRVGLAKKKGIITSAYLSIKQKKKVLVNPDYFYYMLHYYDIEKVFYRFGGGVRQAIGMAEIKRLSLILPPENEQNLIVEMIERIKRNKLKAIKTIKQEISILKEYKESLITNVVTGKIKVPN